MGSGAQAIVSVTLAVCLLAPSLSFLQVWVAENRWDRDSQMMGNLKEQGANHRDGKGLGSGEAHQEVRKAGRGARGAGRGGGREKKTPRGFLG